MRITSRFTVAVHILLAIITFEKEHKTTSDFLAASVNVNPVVVRRVLGSLKEAGIVTVKAGSGGASLARDAASVTLYDVYKAVDDNDGGLFHFHENPDPACPVGKNIHLVLDRYLDDAQAALENELKKTALSNLAFRLNKALRMQGNA